MAILQSRNEPFMTAGQPGHHHICITIAQPRRSLSYFGQLEEHNSQAKNTIMAFAEDSPELEGPLSPFVKDTRMKNVLVTVKIFFARTSYSF